MHQGCSVLADTLQHVHEVIVRVDVVQPAGGQQALHNADVLGAQLSPAEQPVLFAHWDHPQGAFEVVRVDRHLRVIQIEGQPDPALTDIRQRSEKGAARQESLVEESCPGVAPTAGPKATTLPSAVTSSAIH